MISEIHIARNQRFSLVASLSLFLRGERKSLGPVYFMRGWNTVYFRVFWISWSSRIWGIWSLCRWGSVKPKSYQREGQPRNFLSITWCAMKINWNREVCSELLSGTVGWVGFGIWVLGFGRNGGFWEFCSSNPEDSFFSSFYPQFLFLGLGLVLDLWLGLGFWLGLLHTVFTDRSWARSQPYAAVLPVDTI